MDPVLDFLIGVGRFIIMLGVLVFVHELGHFLVAKWCGIYVATFSFGLGKRLFGFKLGDTDYRVSALPFGGYVKMIGQSDMPQDSDAEPDPDEVRCPDHMRFDAKPVWMRLAVSAAGPAMSLLFGIFVYWVMFVVGVPMPRGLAHTKVGYVAPDGPAAKAGITPGDTILKVGEAAPEDWEQLQLAIIGNGANPVEMVVRDAQGNVRTLTVTPKVADGESLATIGVQYYEEFAVEELFPDMPAAAAGMQSGDTIVGIRDPNGELHSASTLQELVREHAGEELVFAVRRNGERIEIPVVPTRVVALAGLEVDGTTVIAVGGPVWTDVPSDNIPNPGDRIVAVSGQPVDADSPYAIQVALEGDAGKPVPVTFQSEGGVMSEARTWTVMLETQQRGLIGIRYMADMDLHHFGPVAALPKAITKFNTTVDQMFLTLGYFVTGRVSTKEIAGPLGIGVLSEQVAKAGWIPYLHMVALITINLGILNLLPIPVLDGGNIAIFALEGVRRRPLSDRAMYYVQHAGLVFIVVLVVFATFNDIRRILEMVFGGVG